jgi:hypothetical protein
MSEGNRTERPAGTRRQRKEPEMKILTVIHDVADYDRWKAVFDEFSPAKGGALFHRVQRSVDDPNNVTIEAGFETVEAATAFRDNPELKQAMQRAGVTGVPRATLFEEVEAVEY